MRAACTVLLLVVACDSAGPHPALPGAIQPPADVPPGLAAVPFPAHADDVVDYTLRATLDPIAHLVHGEGTIVWRNHSTEAVHELWVHLYLNAFKNERSAFLRERVGGRGSTIPEDWGFIDVRQFALRDGDERIDLWPNAELSRPGDDDQTDVRVPLPRPIAPGQSAILETVFDEKLPSIVERTGHQGRFHMVGQWFPKIARLESDGRWAHFPFHHLSEFYADFGTYDVTLDVPEAFTIGATGPVVESHVALGRRIERHLQSDIHDFAWTAWDEYRSLGDVVDGVEITVLYPPGYERLARRDLAAVRFALPYDAARYGPYPYRVLTVVHPPSTAEEAGGMEYPTLITTEGAWWMPAGVRWPESVTVHELGHQWFYGLVATNEAAWPVLDEGLNQYAETDVMARWRGDGSIVDVAGLLLSDLAFQAVGGNMAVHDEPVAQPAERFSNGQAYARLVYARTASIMATLARVCGEPAVTRALGLYTRRERFQHPGPTDLLDAFREVLGPDAARTLENALFEEGWVDYAIDGISTERAHAPAGVFDRDGHRETVGVDPSPEGFSSSVLVRRRGTLSLPVDVELAFADGSTALEHWDGKSDWTRLSPHGPSALRAATVDPDDRVVIDSNRANNAGVARPGAGIGLRTLERAAYYLELGLTVVTP